MHGLAEIPCGPLARRDRGQKRQRDTKDAAGGRAASIPSLEAGFANKNSAISDPLAEDRNGNAGAERWWVVRLAPSCHGSSGPAGAALGWRAVA